MHGGVIKYPGGLLNPCGVHNSFYCESRYIAIPAPCIHEPHTRSWYPPPRVWRERGGNRIACGRQVHDMYLPTTHESWTTQNKHESARHRLSKIHNSRHLIIVCLIRLLSFLTVDLIIPSMDVFWEYKKINHLLTSKAVYKSLLSVPQKYHICQIMHTSAPVAPFSFIQSMHVMYNGSMDVFWEYKKKIIY